MSRVLLAAGGAATFGASVFLGYVVSQAQKPPKQTTTRDPELPDQAHRLQTYDALAPSYDQKVGWDETVMGLSILRRMLVGGHAKGDVLEVAVGTGRNLSFYPKSCASLTISDASPKMLEVAKTHSAKACSVKDVQAVQADAEALGHVPGLAGRQFDTVVDTFGLCSVDRPVEMLSQMQARCKPDGKILLLEHGRSATWDWLSRILDNQVQAHAEKWGCIWNRDITDLVRSSGIEIESISTYHLGTTYYIVGRPGRGRSPRSEALAVAATSPAAVGVSGTRCAHPAAHTATSSSTPPEGGCSGQHRCSCGRFH